MGTYDTKGGSPISLADEDEGTCQSCKNSVGNCTCIECPTCKVIGDPKCHFVHGQAMRKAQGFMPSMKKSRKNSWWSQLCACYKKGYEAYLNGMPIESCPYKPSSYTKGVQHQRILEWSRGYKRARDGKPLMDSNG